MADTGGFPRRFDQYVLLKPLARGGMGELYLAASGARGMEKPCVIKTVLPSLVALDNAQRFRDEAMVVVRLSHGNLVSVFDAGRHGDQIYIAMEYVDGKDLLAVWNRCAQRRVPFPIDVAAYIVKELARGLGYAHAFGGLKLVHRDVSPANVLLSYTGEVKLTDFGLARSTLKLQHTAPGIIFGKLSYLAPEQARSEALDGRTDLYAAGILLWELLTGQQLFPVKLATDGDEAGSRRDSTADALERVRNPQILLPSHVTSRVPPELDAIVMRALAPEPARRYQSGEELRGDLAAFLASTTPQTDAARLAGFLRPLFHELAENERREREALMVGAASLLSGALSVEMPSSALLPPAAPPASMDRDAGSYARRHDDTAPRVLSEGGNRPGEDPRVGATLGGRYLIQRLCGEGAMGRVYEARHVDIGRRVAIKILHSNFRHSEEVVERFRREARAASKIGHPNIIDVTDSGITRDGAFYFVMEYLDGIDLEQLIHRDGQLPLERALLITGQLCRALQAAHASEIIHRDLKPANVMLVHRKDEDDFVKVLDFGISRNMDLEGIAENGSTRRPGLTRPDVAVGTPVYMSPEQAAGMRADALTDVYAVGGLLYEMLSATPPCKGDDVLTVLNKKATEDPTSIGKLRPDLPREVQRLVMRALSRTPQDRHPTMAALKEDVLRCLSAVQGAPTPTGAELRSAPESSGPRRSTQRLVTLRARSWVLGAAVGGLVLLMGVISFVRHGSHAADDSAARGEPPPAPGRVPGAPGARAQMTGNTAARLASPASSAPLSAGAPSSLPSARAPLIVPVDSPPAAPLPSASSLPPQEPVAMKRAARLMTSPRPSPAPPAPSLAAPWPAASPPVFAETAANGGATKRGSGERGNATPAEKATGEAGFTSPPPRGSESPERVLTRGQAAFDRGNYAEAIRRGKEAIAGGAAVPGHLLIGDAYYHLQRYADALREYQATLALEPSNALARRGRELAERAAAVTR